MRFKVNQESLNTALSRIAFALENKDELEAYTHIALRCEDNSVRLTASNRFMNTEARVFTPDFFEAVAFGVNGALLKKIVKSLPEGQVEFILEPSNLVLKSGSTYMTLPVLDPVEFNNKFPSHTDYDAKSISFEEFDLQKFMSCLKKVMRCYDDTKPRYSVIALNNDHLAATDGYQIAFCDNSFFKPNKLVKIKIEQAIRMWKVFGVAVGNAGIFLDESRIHISYDGIACGIRLSSVEIPDYTISLEGKKKFSIEVPRDGLISLLKRVFVFEDSDAKKRKGSARGLKILINISDEKLSVCSVSTFGKIEESISCDHIKEHKFSINSRHLFNAVTNLEDESVEIDLVYNKKDVINKIIVKEKEYINVIAVSE